jgi:hypothetical protein
MKATKVGTEWHGKAMRKRDRQCKEPNLGVARERRNRCREHGVLPERLRAQSLYRCTLISYQFLTVTR